MSIRKRTWTTSKGEERSAWLVDYVDQNQKRRAKSFRLKKEAEAFALTAAVEVRAGVHVADSDSATVLEAGELWLKSAARRVERSTLVQYRQHLQLHIAPHIGSMLLSRLSVPAVRAFEDQLLDAGRSPSMTRKVLTSLGSLIADAQERGLIMRNPVREKTSARQKGRERRSEKRQRGKLKAGVDFPTTQEIRLLVANLEGRWRPVLLTAIFTGLRASELRALAWADIDLDKRVIHVHRRADRYNTIGPPKSASSARDVPIPPIVANTLREWRLACPSGPEGLAFPNRSGNVETLSNIVQRGYMPAQVAAGVTVKGKNAKGEAVLKAKYKGLHSLRHFHASWLINRREDGGLGLPAKVVQDRLGHSSIQLTMDVYAHLFPRADDGSELADAEAALLG
jgi:integrase